MNYMLDTFRKTKQALLTLLLLVAPMFAICAMAQTNSISGRITSAEDGEPLPFVNVSIKGTTTGTVSDIDGNFNIKANKGDILVFSFIDFKTQEVVVADQTNIPVVMESDNQLLDEVVAVGYGVMKKSDLTGAVASIKADALKQTPAAGLDQALQGRAAGVTVNANSGQPGAAAEVRIRGIGSVVGDCSPIYVVDGVITDNIAFLSPSDIASTEILKDASATAIYGSRGANGVILVTTKTGTKGKTNISVDAYYGLQNRWKKLDLMNAKEFAETMVKITAMGSGVSASGIAVLNQPIYDKNGNTIGYNYDFNTYYNMMRSKAVKNYAPYAGSEKGYFDYGANSTDWQDAVFNMNAPIQNYSISMDGANDMGQFAISANFFKQEGTIIGSDYQRLTLRANSDYKIKEWLKVGEHASFTVSEGRNAMNNSSSPGASVISAAWAMAPWDPERYPQGTISADETKDLSGQISAATNFTNTNNPLSFVEYSHPLDKTERFIADMFMDVTPIKGLTWHTSISFDMTLQRNRNFSDKYEHSSFDKRDKSFLSSSITRWSTIAEESTITYNKSIDRFDLSVMLGQTIEQGESYGIGNSGASILNAYNSNNWYLSKTTEDNTNPAGDSVSRSRRASFLGRAHFSLASKYMLTVNFRADGSSKFPQNTWGYFPSFAAAWRLGEEEFVNKDVFSNLKVRLGWGKVGNDKVGDDNFIQKIQADKYFAAYTLGTDQHMQGGATVLTWVNQNGRWEENEQWNAGIDFGVLGGDLNGTIDWFLRDTNDALLNVTAPAHAGNRFSMLKNVGVLRNHGIELSLDYAKSINDFNFNIGANVSYIKNELVSLNGGQPVWGDRTLTDEGMSLRTFWGYEYEGIYQTDEEALAHWTTITDPEKSPVHAGDAKFKDQNNDGKIDDDDRVDIGNPFPWLTYGFNLGANFKGFDLQIFFQGVYGNEIYNASRERLEGDGANCILSKSMKNVWVGYSEKIANNLRKNGLNPEDFENRNGSIPNPAGSPMNKYNNDRFIESGAYLRLKNAQLGYTLPKDMTRKFHFERIRFYVSGSNLLTFTNYSGYDPEVGGGVDYGNYPQSRTVTFGVNLNL